MVISPAFKSRPRIIYYPVFDNAARLDDHIARAAWYLSCVDPVEIVFVAKAGIVPSWKVPKDFAGTVAGFIQNIKSRISVRHVSSVQDGVEAVCEGESFDIAMLWDETELDKSTTRDNRFTTFIKNKPFWRVDTAKTRFEGSFYIKAGLEWLRNKKALIEEEKKRFLEHTEALRIYEKSYLFCTGPTIAQYRKFEYSDGLRIVCNSVIFDEKMLRYINPHVICFADPIFHFGPNKYAVTFMKKLVAVLSRHNMLALIPFSFYLILKHNYPELAEKTIAVPIDFTNTLPPSSNLARDFYVNPFGSVLQLLMLPLASTLTDRLYILGADGKKREYKEYFWSHNKKTQINDQMENIQKAHPAFFNIDYQDFYRKHTHDLRQYIDALQETGKHIETLTPSYQPCLIQRYTYDTEAEPKIDKTIAVYDPDFKAFGHNLYFLMHVANLLSAIYRQVIVFDEQGAVQQAFADKPSNVQIVQLPETLHVEPMAAKVMEVHRNRNTKKKLSVAERSKRIFEIEEDFFRRVYQFIEASGADCIFFSSEGRLSLNINQSIAASKPSLPYFICAHIVWKFAEGWTLPSVYCDFLKNAEALFALEDYLVPHLMKYNPKSFRFPYMTFREDIVLPERIDRSRIKIGTIGVINARRNVDFILNCLKEYTGPSFEYQLLGQPLGDDGELVCSLVEEFDSSGPVQMHAELRYLTDDEFETACRNCDFTLVAYDECRKLQAPGIIYQSTRQGTILIAPRIEPFTIYGELYPGLIVFYDSLSSESLSATIQDLAEKQEAYEKVYAAFQNAAYDFLMDNAHNFQLHCLYKAFAQTTCAQHLVLSHKRTEDIFRAMVKALCDADARCHQIFTQEIVTDIVSDNAAMQELARDHYLIRIAHGEFSVADVIESGLLTKVLNNPAIFSKVCTIDLKKCIVTKEDLAVSLLTQEEYHHVFGSRYNRLSRSDKFFGFFGKLFGAFEIHQTAKEFETIDKPRLAALKNKHLGNRGFILCTGPSLNLVDLSLFKDEITIAANGFYLSFPNHDFRPMYYVIEDELIAEDRRNDINTIINGPLKFFAQRLAYCLNRADDVIFLRHSPDFDPWYKERVNIGADMRFSQDAAIATYGGNTVTYTCMQIMFHLGITELYLIGADHNYEVPKRFDGMDANHNYVIDPKEDDVNHFNSKYFGKGYRWHNPKVHKLEQAYLNARKIFEHHGRKIYNITVGGHLEVFERKDHKEVLRKKPAPAPKAIAAPPVATAPAPTAIPSYSRHPLIARGLQHILAQHSQQGALCIVDSSHFTRKLETAAFKSIPWIGIDDSFNHWPSHEISPTYYLCSKNDLIQQHHASIFTLVQESQANNIRYFFLRKEILTHHPSLAEVPGVIFLEDHMKASLFETVNWTFTSEMFAALVGGVLGYTTIFVLSEHPTPANTKDAHNWQVTARNLAAAKVQLITDVLP
ncbi:MAG: hypothetical protein LDL27_02570 [Desulfovibrio sp.]|nr:hypothetical protein [Desulfovibrio sp.]